MCILDNFFPLTFKADGSLTFLPAGEGGAYLSWLILVLIANLESLTCKLHTERSQTSRRFKPRITKNFYIFIGNSYLCKAMPILSWLLKASVIVCGIILHSVTKCIPPNQTALSLSRAIIQLWCTERFVLRYNKFRALFSISISLDLRRESVPFSGVTTPVPRGVRQRLGCTTEEALK